MHCPCCAHKKFLKLKIEFPTFEHCNLNKISDNLILFECQCCNLIYNPKIKNIADTQKKIFLSGKDYNFSLKKNRISISRNYNYANKIFGLINNSISRLKKFYLLDIGALDGDLLKQLRIKFKSDRKNKNKLNFIGYNYSKKKNFVTNNNLIINSLKLEDCFKNIKKYNVIISINSLQYIKNLNKFLLIIKNSLLEHNSFAFFVVPNSLENISYNFHGDEYYKFNKRNITKLFFRNGLKVNFLTNSSNPGHLMFRVNKLNNAKTFLKFINNSSELTVIKNKINNFLNKVSKISYKFKNNVLEIFGYRINAVFFYYALLKYNFNYKNIFFITDDNIKTKKSLNNDIFLSKLIIFKQRSRSNSNNKKKIIILCYGYKKNNIFKDILKKNYGTKNFITL